MEDNIIKVSFGPHRKVVTREVWLTDEGMFLEFEDLDLPFSYVVGFSNSLTEPAIPMLGNGRRVEIPPQLFIKGKRIYAWLRLQPSDDVGYTVYQVTIPLAQRPPTSDVQPTPKEATIVEQAISSMNKAIILTADAVKRAEYLANVAGYMSLDIDENGHLIYTKTPGVAVDFEIKNGHLYAEVI